jgi:flagellar protein FliT
MSLQLIKEPSYAGEAGILALRSIQDQLHQAAAIEDWGRIRHLDAACSRVIEKVIAANRDNSAVLVSALSELKGVYANLLFKCHQEIVQLEKVS